MGIYYVITAKLEPYHIVCIHFRFQKTGGLLNHTSTITYLNTSQVVKVSQKFLGLDVFDQLKVEINIEGDIPTLPPDARVSYIKP